MGSRKPHVDSTTTRNAPTRRPRNSAVASTNRNVAPPSRRRAPVAPSTSRTTTTTTATRRTGRTMGATRHRATVPRSTSSTGSESSSTGPTGVGASDDIGDLVRLLEVARAPRRVADAYRAAVDDKLAELQETLATAAADRTRTADAGVARIRASAASVRRAVQRGDATSDDDDDQDDNDDDVAQGLLPLVERLEHAAEAADNAGSTARSQAAAAGAGGARGAAAAGRRLFAQFAVDVDQQVHVAEALAAHGLVAPQAAALLARAVDSDVAP